MKFKFLVLSAVLSIPSVVLADDMGLLSPLNPASPLWVGRQSAQVQQTKSVPPATAQPVADAQKPAKQEDVSALTMRYKCNFDSLTPDQKKPTELTLTLKCSQQMK